MDKYILSFLTGLILVGAVVLITTHHSADYNRGYVYGETTGNSYAAPMLPQSDFNKGAAQGAKHKIKEDQ